MTTGFERLNRGWNAEPNAPDPRVRIEGDEVVLTFLLNSFQFPEFSADDVGVLRFRSCSRYRVGTTNDEGWLRGQCRFSRIAPAWGEFYEVTGDVMFEKVPDDWVRLGESGETSRHFLFYFRDEEFECDAVGWSFSVEAGGAERLGHSS